MRGRSFDFWMPGERVKEELIERKPIITEDAACQFECLSLNKDSLITLIRSSKVKFNESWVHGNPRCYILKNGQLKMKFTIHDSVVKLFYISHTEKKCDCMPPADSIII
jgi:hypothetical protein